MSMDCDDDNDNNHTSNTSFPPIQTTNMSQNQDENMNNHSEQRLNPIEYFDSMDLDNRAHGRKPRTLFSLLLDKRRQSTRNRKKQRQTNSNNDNQDKLTKEEIRVAKDLKEISDSKWCARGTIVTIHLSSRLHNFTCAISPAEGYYRDGTFSFDITIDKNYPYSPPQIRSCHPIFHPNINLETFEIGLPILSTDWKAVLSLNDVLFALQLLFMQPNIDGMEQKHNNNNDMEQDNDEQMMHRDRKRMKANGYHRNYGFGVNNHKPSYIANIRYNMSGECHNGSIIQNMKAALMFRDTPREFERICQQIIKGGVCMFGTNWQCIERKKMKNIVLNDRNSEKYDPNIGSQTFRLKDSDRMITKKCSVLRKRRRNESDDVFAMDNVKTALRCFASSTGSMKDGVYYDSGDSQCSLVRGVGNIDIEPPEKKRKIDKGGLTEYDVQGFGFKRIGDNGIHIVQHSDNGDKIQNGFDFPWNQKK